MIEPGDAVVVEARALDALLQALRQRGYEPIGPTVREGAVVLDPIGSADDLPVGWTDEQDAGRYRLRPRGDGALFGHAAGPHSWKRWLHPPSLVRWRARRAGKGFTAEADTQPPPRYTIGADGLVRSARIVPPTAQNQRTIEDDLRHFVPTILDLPKEALTLKCEQAIRNYDPCISCATHFLKLDLREER